MLVKFDQTFYREPVHNYTNRIHHYLVNVDSVPENRRFLMMLGHNLTLQKYT